MITHESIDTFFKEHVTVPGETVLSQEGFTALADWSERQTWWRDFSEIYSLSPGWRSTVNGDSHLFAVNLFAFLNFRLSSRSYSAAAL